MCTLINNFPFLQRVYKGAAVFSNFTHLSVSAVKNIVLGFVVQFFSSFVYGNIKRNFIINGEILPVFYYKKIKVAFLVGAAIGV